MIKLLAIGLLFNLLCINILNRDLGKAEKRIKELEKYLELHG